MNARVFVCTSWRVCVYVCVCVNECVNVWLNEWAWLNKFWITTPVTTIYHPKISLEDRNFAYKHNWNCFWSHISVCLHVKTCHCYQISDLLGSHSDWLGRCYCVMLWRNLWSLRWFGSTQPTTVSHITEVLNLHCHRGDRLQSDMSLPCYKDPHTIILTIVVRWLWRNRNRGLEHMCVNSKWFPIIGLYCSLVRDNKIGRCLFETVERSAKEFI